MVGSRCRLLDGTLFPHGLKFEHCAGFPNTDEGCVLVVPGQYWHLATDRINDAIQRFEWVLLVRTADEEDLFDISKVSHERSKWWVQTPRSDYGDARLFGVGFPPHFNNLPAEPPDKLLNVFLSAQSTHQRRRDCFATLEGLRDSRVHPTAGFTQGLDPDEYVGCMAAAKVAPAPSGAVSTDSFRLYEALESHCVPVADLVSPVDGLTDYWWRVFPDAPFPVYEEWADVKWSELLTDWIEDANRISAWWMRQKRHYVQWLREDLEKLGVSCTST